MNDLLSYVIESFFDSRQEKLNQLNTPEKLKSSDVVEYVRSNMKGSKTKQGAFLREGALYFLNAMAKEGGALDRGKPGTVAPGYAFEGGKREYGRVRGDSPLRKLQRPLIVPEVDYPGVPDSRLQDVVVAEALALFRAWSNRNKPRFFDYKLSKPMTGDSPEVEELMELYRNHNRRFMRIHQLVAENNETQPIYFDSKKGKLPIGTEGIQTGITITRPPQAMWICLKLRKKAGASWTMYTNSVAKLGSMLNRAGMPSMVSTYGKLWDLWTILPDEVSAPEAYDLIGAVDGITRVGRATKGVAFRSFLMDSVLIDESTFSNNTSIFPLSLHIHHGESKVATLQEGEGNQDFTKDSGLSMIPVTGTLAQFDVGIDNHPLQAMYNAPDLVARVYRFARTARIIPQLEPGLPKIEIDTEASNQARNYWTSLKQMDSGDFYEGELKQIPAGRDITIEFDGEKAYLTGFPNDRKLTNLIQTDEFEQLYDRPATAFARISGKDANALAAFISQLDPNDFDEKRVKEAFQDRILTIWGLSCTLEGEFEPFTPISDVSGRFIRAAKQAKPDDIEEMLAVSPEGLIGTVEPSEDRKEEKLIFGEQTTPVVVLGYEKASVQNQEARVIIVGKVVEEDVDVLVPGVKKPTRKAGKEKREQYQEVARVGAFSGFNYDDRKDLLAYMESLNYQREHEGDILIDPVEANIIFEMSYKGLLADKQMWRYNRTAKSKEVGVKQDLPAGGERFVKGVKTRFIMEPKEKNAIAQYNNPKIIGYRSEMGREEQRIYPMLIPSSDVTYGVALKSNPPIQLSKYKNFVEKENSPLIAALGFTDEKFAKEDLGAFRSRMKEKHGASTVVVQSGKTLVAHKKGAKLGETCAIDGCGAPKAFSPPAELRQERAADEGPSVTFNCDVCGRQSYQRDRRNPPLGTKGWNVVLDFDQSKYKDEMKQIKNAFAKMKEWFPGVSFEWDEVLQGGDLGIKDWGPGEQWLEAQKTIQEAADEFSKDRNMLIITDGGYKRTWFGYTSTIYPTGSRDDESFRLWLFALPHLQMYDEEMNFITLCHEIGHALFPSEHYKDERKYYEGQTPIKGRFDDTGHCKDHDCAMSLGSYKMNAFKDQLKKEGRHDNVNMFCELCRAEMGLHNTGILMKKNPLVSVEETEGDMKLATKLLRYMHYDLEEEVKPYLHTNWPTWYRRAERDLIVRGLERFDYQGVIEGMVNKTGSTYYNTMFNIAKRNSGKPLIKNRKEHQELAMLYSLCHNDLELIVAWPNATSSVQIGAFEEELEATGTIVYQKEVTLSRNAAEVLCMQMYAGESFLSKKQCQKKALASGWERSDEPLGKGRKMRVYLYYNDSENSVRGKAAKRKEELREIFKTSSSDRKSYIHTADNAVQVSEYAQVFFNENSLMLLHNCDIDIILPEKPDKAWMMLNSVKKYIQQELGSLFLICSRVTSGSGAYLHGIRRTQDVDFMIDDRRLGPEVKTKMQEVKQMMPWFDFKLAYSNRNLWDFETFVPGKTFYDKRSEMTHNPKYHAYFCGMKVETPETFLYMRTIRASADARPRAVADMLMLKVFMDRGRFLQLKDIYKLVLPIRQIQATVIANHNGNVKGWLQTIKFFMQERYREKYTHAEIQQMIRENRVQTKRNPLDTDAIEERLLAGVEGSFTDESETRRNPGGATVVITVPHALHAGPDVEEHWCDWSAAPAGRQIDKIMSKDHKTILHLADKKRTEIDYNRVASADTKWQYRLDDYIEKASMLLDIHSFPPDDVMWAGYDFVLFNSSEWPQQRQMEQAKLQDHLVKKGYKVFMDIADHRNYIQEKGIKAGIPSFLIEFNEELTLKDSCNDLIEGLEELLPKSNPTPHFFPGDAVKKYPWLKYADLIKTNPHETGHLEPPAPGMTRLWRGGFANKYPLVPRGPQPIQENTSKSWSVFTQWNYGGRYFTTDKEYAIKYANLPGEGSSHEYKVSGEKALMYIDIPNEDLPKYNYHRIYYGPMKDQWERLEKRTLSGLSSWWRLGKITAKDIPYPIYGHSVSTPGDATTAEKEYWIGPDVELYGKVKLHSTWTDNPPKKDLYDVFEEWCSLVNMTNKELETFLNSNWGKVAGLSKQEAKNWNDIKSGRVSGRRILKMREKIGFSGPNDQIKSQIDIGKAWEKALKNWTGPSGDSMKGETDWDWCKRQVRFNKRAGAFPYNQNAEERKGALVKKQKTQNQPSRRLLSLWVWGHDPWRWAYDNDVARMPKCPDTAWVGNKEKRKYGKIEVIAGPKKNFVMSLPYLYSQILRGVVYAEDGLLPKENPPAENITWTKMPPRKMELPGPAAGTPLETFYELRGVDEDGHTVTIKTTKYNTDTEYRNKDGKLFSNTAITSQEWLKGLGVEDYFYVVGIEASKKQIGLGQAAYIQLAKIVPAVLSTNHSESAERAWQGVERNAAQHGLVVHRRKIEYPVGKDTGFRYDRVLMKDTKENPPVFPEPERISKVKGGRYKMDSGQDVSGMHFSDAVILGSDKSINVEWKNQEEEAEPKPAPKSGLRRIRFNMLRPSKFDGYKDAWIVASETSKGHIYSLSVEVQTTLTLKTFPGKKSEPRLRPETYGSLHPLNKIGEITIKSSGKKHPLYDRVFVMDSKENKKAPKNMYTKLAQGKKHKDCNCKKKAYRSKAQAYDDIPYKQGWTVYPCPDVEGVYHASSPRRNKGGGGSERLYGITVRYARTLHPELDVFTSSSMVTRLQDRKLSKQAEPRQMGRVLTRMAREGLIQDLRDGSFRNTEARYREYLAEQEEEPKDNPRTKKGRKVPTRYLKGLNSVERAIAKYEIDKGHEYDIDDPEAYEFWKSDIMAKARGMENQPSTWKLKFIKKYGPLPKGKNIVNRLAKATGIKKKYIQKAYDKGLAAWRGGHRPGVQQHQWALGRAYALVMGAPTSTGKGKPDFKLAVEAGVRDEKGKLLI